MGQLVTVWADSVEYQGESVGREVVVQVDLAGELLSFNKRLRVGEVGRLGAQVVQLWIDADHVSLGGSVRVVERDPVYSEFGATPVDWNFRLQHGGWAESVHTVRLVETGRQTRTATASFVVRLRAQSVAGTRYVSAPENGWLTVRMDANQARASLPETLQVEVARIEGGREYFLIKEGLRRGQRGSVRLNPDGSSLLSERDPRSAGVKLAYSISRKTLTVGGNSYTTIEYPATGWVRGTYDVELPDAPHRGGLNYPAASRSRTWFRIGHSGDRYIHTGAASSGCITVSEVERWDELCALLVRSRKGDGISIGTVQVVE